MQTRTTEKIVAFQGLRGYAALCIFISHYPFLLNSTGKNAFDYLGGLGVELFILLSGYLAAMQTDSDRNTSAILGLKRKIQKFYPLHILTLVAAAVLNYSALLGLNIEAWGSFVLNALMLQSWVPIQSVYFSYNGVAWYLTLTVFFVLISPLLVRFTKHIKPITWAGISAGLVAVEFLWCLLVQNAAIGHWLVYICPVVRLIDFVLGYGAYQLAKELKTSFVAVRYIYISILSAVAACAVLIELSMNSSSRLFAVAVWTLPALVLIMSVAIGANKVLLVRWAFENRMIVFVGNISLEFFLLHQLSIRYCNKIASYIGIEKSVLFGVGICLLSVAAAWICQKLFAAIKEKCKGVDPS